MTGAERLREVSDAIQYGIKLRDVVEFGYARDHRDEASLDLDDVLWDIADQIKREHAEALDRAKAAQQTSVSAYDLLPEEDREAIEWVREHGGLAEVEKRLMPEGIEWPRFEDSEPVRIGDDFERDGDENGVSTVTVYLDGSFALNFRAYSRGERVKRPAPKVLDADGVEVEVGDDLYTVEGMLKFHVSAIDKKSGRIATEAMSALDKWADPKMYTHRAPVLAADGRPLREGETVWGVDGGGPYVVEEPLNKNGLTVLEADGVSRAFSRFPDHLTHERPDSWEQLEDDATVSPEVYCVRRGIDISDVDSAHIVLDDVTERMARDLVCRARALAERGE